MPIAFTVPGNPVPFLSGAAHQKWKRREVYAEYCKAVRMIALFAGVGHKLTITEDAPLYFHTRAFFRNRNHGDPENIHKAVVDAICYKAKGKRDKYTGGAFLPPRYDEKDPRVEIVIADGNLPLRDTIPEGW